MHLSGRLAAAIEVIADVTDRHRPVNAALSDWGRAHRFAGSGDRAAIGNIVYDTIRQRSVLASIMGSDAPRALVLACAVRLMNITVTDLAELCVSKHGPGELTEEETAALSRDAATDAESHIRANVPEWLMPSFVRAFGDDAVRQGQALSVRAPVDIRANSLKTTREKLLNQLSKFNALEAPLAPDGIRIEVPDGLKRTPNLEAEPAFQRGAFEIQDAASQVAAHLCAVQAGHQVADICAGAGGKTLALAAAMGNKGQIHAWDADRNRLKPIIARLNRAGAHNVQVIPADEPERLDELTGRMDRVLVDAPCSGSGSWRRKPDAKWRLTRESLANRGDDQRAVLARAAPLVKPGGRLVYVTCSLLPEENIDQIEAFLASNPDFSIIPHADVWSQCLPGDAPASSDGSTDTLLLSPADHEVDGFFIAVMQRQG
ncbi:MAG: RsmB/NOP family class I SAM-dependent RNA methyltransferase [Pseudomonadota bacterium]